jgi:acetoin utilization deacetylase AcuC-like enzyme
VEEDFEWVTDKLVQLANRCCEGRVVSVLEGGYQLGGEYCSAFAQSAKVRPRECLFHCTPHHSRCRRPVPRIHAHSTDLFPL